MKASECYVGMKMQLTMEWAEWDRITHRLPRATATCIYIPTHKRFAVCQFDNGIRQTVTLVDDSKLGEACDSADEVKPVKRNPENGQTIRDLLKSNGVTEAELSARLGKCKSYVSEKLRENGIRDEELRAWRKLIYAISAEQKRPLATDDRHYKILKALRDTGMTRTEFSRLSGHRAHWLSEKLRYPMTYTEEKNIAQQIYAMVERLPSE